MADALWQPRPPVELAVAHDKQIYGSTQYRRLPEDHQLRVRDTQQRATAIVEKLVPAIERVVQDHYLNEAGKTLHIQKVVQGHLEQLGELESALALDEAQHDTTREHLEHGWLVSDGAGGRVQLPVDPSGDELALQLDLRRRLEPLDPNRRAELYLQAVQKGDNPRLVQVVESADAYFPLVDAGTLNLARKYRLNSYPDPVKEEFLATEESLFLRRNKVDAVRRQIAELAAAVKA